MIWTRRNMIWGAGAAACAAALGGIGWSVRELFSAKQYPPTPYDDVLAHLSDRDAAAHLGRNVLSSMPNLETSAAANTVRARLSHQSLRAAVAADAVEGRLVEVQGWIIPETLALLGALAARV